MSKFMIAILLGIFSHSLLQLAQSMERHGIEIFDKMRAKIKGTEYEIEGGAKKPTIYVIGFILHQTAPIWAMLVAASGAPMSYYTSVFGLGLLVSLTYSAKILKEKIQRIEYIGAAILIVGTLLLGIDAILQPELNMGNIDINRVFLFIGVLGAVGGLGIVFALKSGSKTIIGIVFGLFSGSFGSLDPVFKGIGQNYGVAEGLPVGVIGWVIFILSFAVGALSFTITQWGFARKANVSTVLPCINSTYVTIPILLQLYALEGFTASWFTFFGLAATVVGIILMTAFKKNLKPLPKL